MGSEWSLMCAWLRSAFFIPLTCRGSSVVVCTCSTLSGAAEQLTNAVGIPVVRIDRPMAQRAAALGGRIAVVVAVPSSLAPTRDLLIECIAAARNEATLIEAPCLDAGHLFQAGDFAGYVDQVGAHARLLADRADVIVLAQASMAPAADQLTDLPIVVLCSPAIAAERAIAIARGNLRR